MDFDLRTTEDKRWDYGYVRMTIEHEEHDQGPRTPLVPVVRCRKCGRLERLDGKDPVAACLWIERWHSLCQLGRPWDEVEGAGSLPKEQRRRQPMTRSDREKRRHLLRELKEHLNA